ncbi:MAG TPA: glycosyltransferase family 39 protein [Terriglobales bacterium]|nr:glycosyltransferase family 39 protein [Terriglobales bacterium]
MNEPKLGTGRTAGLFLLFAVVLVALHASLLRLPYYWDEAGYYIPAARDLFAGSLIPHSTPSNAHPPLVMAWLALCWKIFGQSIVVTRCAMLLMAALSLLGFFRLARTVANTPVAIASTLLVAIYPVFFAQSSLAQIDLASAGFIFWGLESYFERRSVGSAVWFTLAALTKETAILVPLALLCCEVVSSLSKTKAPAAKATSINAIFGTAKRRALPGLAHVWPLILPIIPLAAWYGFHYARTGRVFGNPDFFRYNVQGTLHPLRIVLALFLRIWQAVGYLDLYVLTLACAAAMMFLPIKDWPSKDWQSKQKIEERSRINFAVQYSFLAIIIMYVVALSVIGGAVLARYMLPVVPLIILISVSTIWRRLPAWKAVLGVVALAFISSLFINPPYGFAPEDNLAYRDYIRLHQRAETFLRQRYPNARVLTAWPASDELTRPYLGYVQKPVQVVRIENFSIEEMLSAAEARSRFDVALVFSTKYQPHSVFDRWRLWQQWKLRYFDFHLDIGPEAAASVLGGNVVYAERRGGQWVGVITIQRFEEARLSGL